MSKIKKFFKSPYYAVGNYIFNRCPNILSDKYFLKVLYKRCFGTKLNLKNPQTFNEKLQWLKLYDRNPQYTTLVDKYRVKQYIADTIGSEYVIPTLAVYKSVDEIDIDKLPDKFVLKCNHDSGSIIICYDKKTFDFDAAKAKLRKALKHNYYWVSREWPYKNIKRCIIAEPLLQEKDSQELHDYKFYCFNGKVEYFGYSIGESSHNVRNIKFNRNIEDIDYLFKKQSSLNKNAVSLPSNIEEMVSLADKVSGKMTSSHIRIDMYNIDGKIYIGEFTLYSSGGIVSIANNEYQQHLADLIQIKPYKK